MPRDLKRIERIMYKLGKLWVNFPDQRFGQLLFNYTRVGTRTDHTGTVRDPFHYEDKGIEEDLDNAIKQLLPKKK